MSEAKPTSDGMPKGVAQPERQPSKSGHGETLAFAGTALHESEDGLHLITAEIIAHQGMLEAGVAFIQKPFSVEEMVSKVRQVLDNGSHDGLRDG